MTNHSNYAQRLAFSALTKYMKYSGLSVEALGFHIPFPLLCNYINLQRMCRNSIFWPNVHVIGVGILIHHGKAYIYRAFAKGSASISQQLHLPVDFFFFKDWPMSY
jgi:hypothetical protein